MLRKTIAFGRFKIALPGSRLGRLGIGIGLIIGGLLGFLPIVGFWMLPLGLLVLSVDSPVLRRLRRRGEIVILRRWRSYRTRLKSSEG